MPVSIPRRCPDGAAGSSPQGGPPLLAGVVLPVRHRSQMLRHTVRSVLEQELGDGGFELLLCLAHPVDDADRAEARRLAAADAAGRVRVVEAAAPGLAAARNAGVRAARGEVLAFLDDGLAQPGWLAAGVAAVRAGADLVQGVTRPVAAPFEHWQATSIERPSGRWECTSLFVRRTIAESAGPFDEGLAYGEEAEWGWRLVRAEARQGFAEGAVVLQALRPRDLLGLLRDRAALRGLPLLLRRAPEAAVAHPEGRFLDARHAVLAASLGLAATSAVARAAGAPRLARATRLAAAAGLLSPARHALPGALRSAAVRGATEAVELGALAYGSLRHRRLVV